jgi:hypothetical protein
MIITAYMIFAIFSCAYTYTALMRPGVSQTQRRDFISIYIVYVLVYICVWLPYLGLRFFSVYVLSIYEGSVTSMSLD